MLVTQGSESVACGDETPTSRFLQRAGQSLSLSLSAPAPAGPGKVGQGARPERSSPGCSREAGTEIGRRAALRQLPGPQAPGAGGGGAGYSPRKWKCCLKAVTFWPGIRILGFLGQGQGQSGRLGGVWGGCLPTWQWGASRLLLSGPGGRRDPLCGHRTSTGCSRGDPPPPSEVGWS